MHTIRFILDDKLVELENVDPCRTVLQYLREDVRKLGSKEGCAEGDCGACTVVIAEAVNQRLQFRALNTCIQLLPTLDGKMLLTVESLKSKAGELHPVQQSLVDHHGSQCGFCTPGFVMSMFAMYKTAKNIDRTLIDDTLSGNLCRCTGYRPIIDACQHLADYAAPSSSLLNPSPDMPCAEEREMVSRLNQLQRQQGLSISNLQRQYFAPASADELAQIYDTYPQACILAGGTDVGLWVTKQLRELPDIIYIGHVAALKQIVDTATDIEIGAAVTLQDAFQSLLKYYPELSELCRRFASLPVRNAGTLVGNIANASPIGDSSPVLICLGARIRLRQASQIREIALEDFFIDYQKTALQPGEYIDAVLIPKPQSQTSRLVRSYKLSKRFDQDISAVCAAFVISLEGNQIIEARIAFGGMAAIPKRALHAETALQGEYWTESTVLEAMSRLDDDYRPLSDMRASAAYRGQVAANLLYRFYLETRLQNALPQVATNVFEVQA